jgi:hypothetical protein
VRQWHASSLSETFTQQYVAFNGRAAQSRLDFKRRATCLARYTLPSLELILQSRRAPQELIAKTNVPTRSSTSRSREVAPVCLVQSAQP